MNGTFALKPLKSYQGAAGQLHLGKVDGQPRLQTAVNRLFVEVIIFSNMKCVLGYIRMLLRLDLSGNRKFF